jgi:hypothetical protein
MRDFEAELRGERFWDDEMEAIYLREGEALVDRALQHREEVIGLCAFLETHAVRRYLEVGVWTGRLVTLLHGLFHFDRVAACDHGWAEQCGLPIRLPPDCDFFRGDADSDAFRAWRAGLGAIDLVLIDANHHYKAVRKDFEIARSFPHRFVAFHDITGARRGTEGVARLWKELDGHKHEIVAPGSKMGIGIWAASPPVRSGA